MASSGAGDAGWLQLLIRDSICRLQRDQSWARRLQGLNAAPRWARHPRAAALIEPNFSVSRGKQVPAA